jgi:hypothetical protein
VHNGLAFGASRPRGFFRRTSVVLRLIGHGNLPIRRERNHPKSPAEAQGVAVMKYNLQVQCSVGDSCFGRIQHRKIIASAQDLPGWRKMPSKPKETAPGGGTAGAISARTVSLGANAGISD